MILNYNRQDDYLAQGVEKKEVGIATHLSNKISYLLTRGLYSDPIQSVVRELCSNMVDATLKAGKDIEEFPAMVGIKDNTVYFKDQGSGMDKEMIDNIYLVLLNSDKENSNEFIGSFGLGSKSPLAVSDEFFVRTVKDEYFYELIITKSSVGFDCFVFAEGETDDVNGTTVTIPIEPVDKGKWIDKIIKVVPFFKGIAVSLPHSEQQVFDEICIKEFQNFVVKGPANDKAVIRDYPGLKILIGPVLYKLDKKEFPSDIILKFGIGDGLQPTPSRESLIVGNKEMEIIQAKYEDAKKEIYDILRDTPTVDFDEFLGNKYMFTIGKDVWLSQDSIELFFSDAPLPQRYSYYSFYKEAFYRYGKGVYITGKGRERVYNRMLKGERRSFRVFYKDSLHRLLSDFVKINGTENFQYIKEDLRKFYKKRLLDAEKVKRLISAWSVPDLYFVQADVLKEALTKKKTKEKTSGMRLLSRGIVRTFEGDFKTDKKYVLLTLEEANSLFGVTAKSYSYYDKPFSKLNVDFIVCTKPAYKKVLSPIEGIQKYTLEEFKRSRYLLKKVDTLYQIPYLYKDEIREKAGVLREIRTYYYVVQREYRLSLGSKDRKIYEFIKTLAPISIAKFRKVICQIPNCGEFWYSQTLKKTENEEVSV